MFFLPKQDRHCIGRSMQRKWKDFGKIIAYRLGKIAVMRWQGKLMQVTYIGLSEYFERCIPQAKREGYLFIISLIARYSDAQDLYEKLEKDWASLNDLTGDKILFVFSTPKVRKRASFFICREKNPMKE